LAVFGVDPAGYAAVRVGARACCPPGAGDRSVHRLHHFWAAILGLYAGARVT